MRKFLSLLFLLCLPALLLASARNIRIATAHTDLILQTSPEGRLYQVYFGERLREAADTAHLQWNAHGGTDPGHYTRGWEVCPGAGNESYFLPALAITHADGNRSTYLYYKSHEVKAIPGGTETVITLADDRYPVTVKLHYAAYDKEDVIKAWSEIRHRERRPVTLWGYASTMLYLTADRYYLTEYHSGWAKEGQPATQQLQYGKKVIDSQLGTMAARLMEPFFELGLNGPARENEGEALLGTLCWTGNFRFTFEIDDEGDLRLIPSINPYASDYRLAPGTTFTTPAFVFSRSADGTGTASRNLHDWARRYQLRDGMGDRMTLLNNWEMTYFDFDQEKLSRVMKDAKDLGVDLFLLDDGWFGNKYPRSNDRAGLGDWEATRAKLPDGLPGLARAAREAGVKLGIWIEPEMVNPKSELFERHPDWAITLPNRKTYYVRNQLVLDLTNPKVQDYVVSVIDRIMEQCPELAYFKWDCNSTFSNVYSHYLGEHQGQLYIDYVRGLYSVLDRVRAKYPQLAMMLCSGGGARCDYGALQYFTEFWCSDDTDPYERLYIQWSLSKFFPAKAMAAHVTAWNGRTSVKFRTDVASMCKLGFDIDLHGMSPDDLAFCRGAVTTYNRLKPVIQAGDQYRLVSPYETNHMAVSYVSKDRRTGVLFAYDLHPRFDERLPLVRLRGLDPQARYRVEEINLRPGAQSSLPQNGRTFSGDYLMKVGLAVLTGGEGNSRVIELKAE